MNRALEIAKRLIVGIVAAIAVVMVLFTAVTLVTEGKADSSFFGYRGYIVRTDSMSATDFGAGDFIITKELDPAELRVGDIISFVSHSPESYGETVTHKIRALTSDSSGRPAFVTYGTTTNSDDEATVSYEQVIGKYLCRIPFAGRLFAFVRTVPGYIICVFLPFLFLIAVRIADCVHLYKQYRRELEAERKINHLQDEE